MRLNILYISYEYPPDTGGGGIGTYTFQISGAMSERGHLVEVICGGKESRTYKVNENLTIHRVAAAPGAAFREAALHMFTERIKKCRFDLIESPEYHAEGLLIKRQYPEIPMVVRLHTPTWKVMELNGFHDAPLVWKLKYELGRLVKRDNRISLSHYNKSRDKEFQLATLAELLVSPSVSLKEITDRAWNIKHRDIKVIANSYKPTSALLDLKIESDNKTITFIGRLEIRKGIIELVAALKLFFERNTEYKIVFVGDTATPIPFMDCTGEEYIRENLTGFLSRVVFLGKVSQSQLPDILDQTDICVFPSRWENFPYVCLEAMSAGRGIVASKHGGMIDMLEDINGGLIVDPFDKEALAGALQTMAEEKELRWKMGRAAREKVISYYADRVVSEIESSYYAVK